MPENLSQINSTLGGLEREFGIIAHNLANVSTAGYKRRCNAFSQSLVAQGIDCEARINKALDLITTFDFSQGNVVQTERSLDFALCGKGFFVIETPQGPLYTRNGTFHLDNNGHIVDSAGRIVAGESGPIAVPPNVGLSQISVSNEGSIRAGGVLIGRFRLVDFEENEKKLLAAGANCFSAPEDARPQAARNLVVRQGFQEGSNVQLVEELVDMMMVSRLYEANVQGLSARKDTSRSILDVAMS